MQCYYFKMSKCLLLTLMLSACARNPVLLGDRKNTPDFKSYEWDTYFKPDAGNSTLLFEDIYEHSKSYSACQYLNELSLEKNPDGVGRFRLLSYVVPNIDSNFFNPDEIGRNEVRCQMKWWPFPRKVCNEEIPYMASIRGQVDIYANPLYQIGVTEFVEVPARTQFLNLARGNLPLMPLFLLPVDLIRRLGEFSGLVNIYQIRNHAYQKEINKKLPGIFNIETKHYELSQSLPYNIYRNGSPDLLSLEFTEADSREDKIKKAKSFAEIINQNTQASSLFKNKHWMTLGEDMRYSISLAVRGFQSNIPQEQVCATTLFNRTFSQLLIVMGYESPIIKEIKTNTSEAHSAFPPFGEMLVNYDHARLKICPVGGLFIKNNDVQQMSEDTLSDGKGSSHFALNKFIDYEYGCDSKNAVPYGAVTKYKRRKSSDYSNANDLIEFLNGLTHFILALNPGAIWWNNDELLKMNPVGDIQKKGTRAVLPPEAYALSLGLVNVLGSILESNHIVYLDRQGKETIRQKEIVGIRISENRRENGSSHNIRTEIRSAALLADLSFKASEALHLLELWYESNQNEYERADPTYPCAVRSDREIEERNNRYTADARERAEKICLLARMFGSSDGSLAMLRELFKKDKGSLKEQLEDLKLVSTLLLLSFLEHKQDGSYDCYKTIENNPETGREIKISSCSKKTHDMVKSEFQIWKDALTKAAQYYNSPALKRITEKLPNSL